MNSREATESRTVALKEDIDEVNWSHNTFGDLSETKEFGQVRVGYKVSVVPAHIPYPIITCDVISCYDMSCLVRPCHDTSTGC